jgi:hypothetical protein
MMRKMNILRRDTYFIISNWNCTLFFTNVNMLFNTACKELSYSTDIKQSHQFMSEDMVNDALNLFPLGFKSLKITETTTYKIIKEKTLQRL